MAMVVKVVEEKVVEEKVEEEKVEAVLEDHDSP